LICKFYFSGFWTQAVATSVGLGRDVAPHFALFKDEGHSFGNRIVLLRSIQFPMLVVLNRLHIAGVHGFEKSKC